MFFYLNKEYLEINNIDSIKTKLVEEHNKLSSIVILGEDKENWKIPKDKHKILNELEFLKNNYGYFNKFKNKKELELGSTNKNNFIFAVEYSLLRENLDNISKLKEMGIDLIIIEEEEQLLKKILIEGKKNKVGIIINSVNLELFNKLLNSESPPFILGDLVCSDFYKKMKYLKKNLTLIKSKNILLKVNLNLFSLSKTSNRDNGYEKLVIYIKEISDIIGFENIYIPLDRISQNVTYYDFQNKNNFLQTYNIISSMFGCENAHKIFFDNIISYIKKNCD